MVIPAKNEASNIGWVLQRLPAYVDEVVLVDGRSTDGTVDVARALWPDVRIVPDPRSGKGAALRAGVEAASGDDIVMIDADGSMDPREMDLFLQPLREGHDVVKGSRFLPGAGTADMTPLRSIGNRCLLALANVLFGGSNTDLCYGFAAFRRDCFIGLGLTADGFEIETQFYLRARRQGLRVVEVPSFESARRTGNSNLNTFRDGWRVLRTIFEERVRGPFIPRAPQATPAFERAGGVLAGVTMTTVSSATAAMFDAAVGRPIPIHPLGSEPEVRIAPRPRRRRAADIARGLASLEPQIRATPWSDDEEPDVAANATGMALGLSGGGAASSAAILE